MCSIKKEGGVVRFVTLQGFSMTRGSTISQADRRSCPARDIRCIDERIVVAELRLPETSISVCRFHP